MNILSEVCQNRYLMREVGNRINDVIAVRPMEQVLEGSQYARKFYCLPRYYFIRKLGEGSYGRVSEVYDHQEQRRLAIKRIKIPSETGIPLHVLRYVALIKTLLHPNIVKYVANNYRLFDVHYMQKYSSLYFTLEFHPYNLEQHIKRQGRLSPHSIKSFMREILSAVCLLEKRGIAHRDLKPQNILVTEEGHIKICDFGQSKLMNRKYYKHTTEVSTLWYRAPELLLGALEYGSAIDMWAIGCVFAYMVTGNPFFQSECEIGQIFTIFRLCGTPKVKPGSPLYKWIHLSPLFPKYHAVKPSLAELCSEGNNLLTQMLELEPDKRISAGKAMHHLYFEGCD